MDCGAVVIEAADLSKARLSGAKAMDGKDAQFIIEWTGLKGGSEDSLNTQAVQSKRVKRTITSTEKPAEKKNRQKAI